MCSYSQAPSCCLNSLLCQGMSASPSLISVVVYLCAFSFLRCGLIHCLEVITPKNGTNIHLKWHLSLFNFRFPFLHRCNSLCSVLWWPMQSLSYPASNLSSAIPKNKHLVTNLISCWSFFWNIPWAGAGPSGSHLYLPNWCEGVVNMMITHLVSVCGSLSLHL